MTTVMISRYTIDGTPRFAVLVNGCAAMAETTEEQRAMEYARALYHNCRGRVSLVHYNGDTGEETVLDTEARR